MEHKEADILLVDDHSLIIEGIKFIASNIDGVGNIYTATTGKEAMGLIEQRHFELYILDMELPDADGFDLIQYVLHRNKDAKILIDTVHDEIWTVKRLAESGVKGVILKTADTNELAKAIQSILEGKLYFCPHFKKILAYALCVGNASENLSSREIEVLHLIAQGLSTREIAEQLCLSINTIESHRKNLFVKLGAKNSVDLVMKAINKGMYNLLEGSV